MKNEYDFSNAQRGPAVAPVKGKTRITIMLDDDILATFREQSAALGRGYQTLINDALKDLISQPPSPEPLGALESVLRLSESLREEMEHRKHELTVAMSVLREASSVVSKTLEVAGNAKQHNIDVAALRGFVAKADGIVEMVPVTRRISLVE
ncbi:BrnA antitoxin family protein [Burkholderia gladioli]